MSNASSPVAWILRWEAFSWDTDLTKSKACIAVTIFLVRFGISSFRTVASSPEISFFRFVGVSSVSIFPWSIMPMRSQSRSASFIMCVVSMIVVLFSRLIFLMNSLTSTVDWGSNPNVGSSRNSTFGMLSNALITFILCLMPVENVPTLESFHLLSWTSAKSSFILWLRRVFGML